MQCPMMCPRITPTLIVGKPFCLRPFYPGNRADVCGTLQECVAAYKLEAAR